MNTLTSDGKSVIDASGKAWALDTSHPMPLPEEISFRGVWIYFWYPKENNWVRGHASEDGLTMRERIRAEWALWRRVEQLREDQADKLAAMYAEAREERKTL